MLLYDPAHTRLTSVSQRKKTGSVTHVSKAMVLCLGVMLLIGCRPKIPAALFHTYERIEITMHPNAKVTFIDTLDLRRDGTFVWTSDHSWEGEHSGLDDPHWELKGTVRFDSGRITCFNEKGEVWCRLEPDGDNLLMTWHSDSDTKVFYKVTNIDPIPVYTNRPPISPSASGWMVLAMGTGYNWRSATDNDKREMCSHFASVSRHGVSAQTFYNALETAYNSTAPEILRVSIKLTAQYAEDFSEGFRK